MCACGAKFLIEHTISLSYPKGGFPSIRHNEIRDLTANLLTEVCTQTNIATCYRKQEDIKKRAYEQRVREVEHSTVTPLVLSATGGIAPQATAFYKQLAGCLAEKWDQPYSNSTMAWLRCRLSYSLLRSAIQCIRGARSCSGLAVRAPQSIELVTSEPIILPFTKFSHSFFCFVSRRPYTKQKKWSPHS